MSATFAGRGAIDVTAVPPVVTLRLTGTLTWAGLGLRVNSSTDVDFALVGADGRASLLLSGATGELPSLGLVNDRLVFGGGERTLGLAFPLVLALPDGRPACEGPPFAVARDISVAMFMGGSHLSIGPAGQERRYTFKPKKDGCKDDMFCGKLQLGPDGTGPVLIRREWIAMEPIALIPGAGGPDVDWVDLNVHLLQDLNGTIDVCSGRMEYTMDSGFLATVFGHQTEDLSVNCTLTTGTSTGQSHTVQGAPLDDFGRGRIVAVSVVPKTGKAMPDRILHLPTDAITEMPLQVFFDECGWRQLRKAYCKRPTLV